MLVVVQSHQVKLTLPVIARFLSATQVSLIVFTDSLACKQLSIRESVLFSSSNLQYNGNINCGLRLCGYAYKNIHVAMHVHMV